MWRVRSLCVSLSVAVAAACSDGTGPGSVVPPVIPATLTHLSAGANHNCGLTSAGAAFCWGSNADGALGDGTGSDQSRPVAVSGGLVFQTIKTGRWQPCGLTTGGAVYCWGSNNLGELGVGGQGGERWSPVAVSGGLAFQSFGAGESHICGLTMGGADYCWGWNRYGQLGDGTTTNRLTPVPVVSP